MIKQERCATLLISFQKEEHKLFVVSAKHASYWANITSAKTES